MFETHMEDSLCKTCTFVLYVYTGKDIFKGREVGRSGTAASLIIAHPVHVSQNLFFYVYFSLFLFLGGDNVCGCGFIDYFL